MESYDLLYIDDEQLNLELFRINFSKNFKVLTIDSPLKALEIIKNSSFKVIVSDYKMPDMNGMELINEIKKDNPTVPCIILSGFVESDIATNKDMLFKYLTKPWKKSELIAVFNDAMNN